MLGATRQQSDRGRGFPPNCAEAAWLFFFLVKPGWEQPVILKPPESEWCCCGCAKAPGASASAGICTLRTEGTPDTVGKTSFTVSETAAQLLSCSFHSRTDNTLLFGETRCRPDRSLPCLPDVICINYLIYVVFFQCVYRLGIAHFCLTPTAQCNKRVEVVLCWRLLGPSQSLIKSLILPLEQLPAGMTNASPLLWLQLRNSVGA